MNIKGEFKSKRTAFMSEEEQNIKLAAIIFSVIFWLLHGQVKFWEVFIPVMLFAQGGANIYCYIKGLPMGPSYGRYTPNIPECKNGRIFLLIVGFVFIGVGIYVLMITSGPPPEREVGNWGFTEDGKLYRGSRK